MDMKEIVKKMEGLESAGETEELRRLMTKIFEGMKSVAAGWLQIAQSADVIKTKKYYRQMGYETFEFFCKDIFGLTGKMVNLYIRINGTLSKYPALKEPLSQFSFNKMEIIVSAIGKIESSIMDTDKKKEKISALICKINPLMSQGEIEDRANKITKNVRFYL